MRRVYFSKKAILEMNTNEALYVTLRSRTANATVSVKLSTAEVGVLITAMEMYVMGKKLFQSFCERITEKDFIEFVHKTTVEQQL